jgi:hypothetical protein
LPALVRSLTWYEISRGKSLAWAGGVDRDSEDI